MIPEELELLERPEVSVGDPLVGACESTAGELESEGETSDQEPTEDEADEIQETQTLPHKVENLIRDIKEVARENKQPSRKGKEPLHESGPSRKGKEPFHESEDTLLESLESTAICELKLKLQLAEQENKNLTLRAQMKHDRSVSADLEIDHEPKRARPVKILSGADLYKSTNYAHYRDFCHQMVRHLHYSVMDRWRAHREEKTLAEAWEPLKEFLDDLLEDKANRTHNTWMEWLQASKRDGESDEEYLRRYNELQFQIGDEANKADKIQVMLFYCGLNEPMHRKIHEQSQLSITTEDMVALAKKLRPNLPNHKHKAVPPYRKKSEPCNKGNDRPAAKPEGKPSQGERDRSIKCFNCDRTGHIAKDCRLPKKERLSTETANKGGSRSSHKVYGSAQKDEPTDKKAKEKPVKADPPKKGTV